MNEKYPLTTIKIGTKYIYVHGLTDEEVLDPASKKM